MIFIQREGTTGAVSFTGDAARVLDAQGQVVVDWTTGGTLSGIPQGSGYRLEVRTGSNVVADDLAVGAVVFVMGQSNIQRWFDTPPNGTPTTGLYQMDSTGKIGAVEGGAAQHFAEGYAAALGVPVMVVAGARGGTALLPEEDKGNGHWLDTSPGSLYATMLARLQDVGGKAELVLWGQGETDASGGTTTSAYAAGLTTFMQRVLADFEPDRVLIQEIGPRGSNDGKYDAVRAAQYQVANAMAGVDIGALTTDLNTLDDGIHLSGASRTLAADRMLIEALKLEGIDLTRALWTGSDGAGDTRTAGGGRDELRGLGGADLLDGGDGSDVLLGGEGADTLYGGGGLDIMRGDGGNDLVEGGGGDDVLSGGTGADTLRGGDGADEIWADADNDTVEGGAGNDLIYGEGGSDTAAYAGVRAGYVVTVSGGTITVTDINLSDGDDGKDTLFGVEFLQFLDGTVQPSNSSLPSLFSGSADFADFSIIVANAYDPSSLYNGQGGNDEVYLPVDAAAALQAGYDPTRPFDGGSGDDIIIGGTLADTIRGGSGADILNGGAGADRMDGGTGDDTYYIDDALDVAFERPDEGIDTVVTTVTDTLKSNVENLTLGGTGDIGGSGNDLGNLITGNAGANNLSGRGGSDTLVGGAGNDTLNGGEGADTLIGGAGDDRYTLEDALDTVVEEVGGGNDLVQAAFSFTLAANIERGGLLGTGDFSITGSAEANRLDGNAGANVLDGGGGADTLLGLDGADQLWGGEGTDTLEGGLGADTLTGGAGNDRFVYRTIEEVAGDVVADFVRGDRIDFSRLDAIASTAAVNDTFVFRGTGAITGAGQVNFAQNAAANTTTLFGHVDGDGVADFSLTVLGLVSFVSSDIAL